MGFKKWCVSKLDKVLAKELAEECGVDPIVALIASTRGYADPMDLEQFLMSEPVFSDPKQTADIIIAAEIVNAAIEDGVKIAVYGDYDCDGVTATALFYGYLKARNADCVYYIPDRFSEGYGMNKAAIEKLAGDGVKLIVTVDNGISAVEEVAFAKSIGIDVVVTDHHLPPEQLPEADAVVDPHRSDCPSAFKDICGVEVAFRLVCVMENKEPEELLPYFADILSLGLTADVMPLTLENRSIVKYGLQKLKNSPCVGLSALMNVAGLDRQGMTASKIAFGLAPRINAAGRMGDAARAVELLISENMMSALAIANEIDGENSLRQQTEKQIMKEAVLCVESNSYAKQRVIVCEGKNWHHGVVGIVASKLMEKYGRPVILLSVGEDGMAHGSGRSIEGFNLFEAIKQSSVHLEKFGGHELAAGVTLKSESIPAFRKEINQYAKGLAPVAPMLHIDCKLNAAALTVDLATAIKDLEPFGKGNPTPVFGIYGVSLQSITPIGSGRHLRLLFTKGENTFTALLFGVTAESFCFEIGDSVDLAVSVEENIYKGEVGISVQLKAIRMNGTDDTALFEQLYLYEQLCLGEAGDYTAICPQRAEVGEVYRYICEKPRLEDRIKYFFINSLGLGKTLCALEILRELDLCEEKNGVVMGIKTAQKTDLGLSHTYRTLNNVEGI